MSFEFAGKLRWIIVAKLGGYLLNETSGLGQEEAGPFDAQPFEPCFRGAELVRGSEALEVTQADAAESGKLLWIVIGALGEFGPVLDLVELASVHGILLIGLWLDFECLVYDWFCM